MLAWAISSTPSLFLYTPPNLCSRFPAGQVGSFAGTGSAAGAAVHRLERPAGARASAYGTSSESSSGTIGDEVNVPLSMIQWLCSGLNGSIL